MNTNKHVAIATCALLFTVSEVAALAADDFRHVSDSAISGHNEKKIRGTVGDCKLACVNEQAFECRSFDYNKNDKSCDLSDKREADIAGGLKTDYPDNPYDYYERIGSESQKPHTQVDQIVPAGILELRHEAGYVADFFATWMEPNIVAGQTVMMPNTWSSGNVTLGWHHTLLFPPGSTNINVFANGYVFIGKTKPIFKKTFDLPLSKCIKIFGTVAALSHAECAPGDFTDGLKAASKFTQDNAKMIELIAKHVKDNADNVDDVITSIYEGDAQEAARLMDMPGLIRILQRNGYIASTPPLGVEFPTPAGEYFELPAQNLSNKEFGELVLRGFPSFSLSVAGGIGLGTAGSHSRGFGFSTKEWIEGYSGEDIGDSSDTGKSPKHITTAMQGLVWQVCCDFGSVGGSVSLGFWTDKVDELSGLAHGYGGGVGFHPAAGVSVFVWYGYGTEGRLVAEPKRLLGYEITYDAGLSFAPVSGGYYRSWTCTHLQRESCPNVVGE